MNRYPPYNPDIPVQREIGEMQKRLARWRHVREEWGPRVWYYIHATAARYVKTGVYTDTQIDNLVEWVRALPMIIPCRVCKYGFIKYVLSEPYDALRERCSDSRVFFEWMVDVHNRVNQKLNKKIIEYIIVYNYFSI
jgi:hypothetical protein